MPKFWCTSNIYHCTLKSRQKRVRTVLLDLDNRFKTGFDIIDLKILLLKPANYMVLIKRPELIPVCET